MDRTAQFFLSRQLSLNGTDYNIAISRLCYLFSRHMSEVGELIHLSDDRPFIKFAKIPPITSDTVSDSNIISYPECTTHYELDHYITIGSSQYSNFHEALVDFIVNTQDLIDNLAVRDGKNIFSWRKFPSLRVNTDFASLDTEFVITARLMYGFIPDST